MRDVTAVLPLPLELWSGPVLDVAFALHCLSGTEIDRRAMILLRMAGRRAIAQHVIGRQTSLVVRAVAKPGVVSTTVCRFLNSNGRCQLPPTSGPRLAAMAAVPTAPLQYDTPQLPLSFADRPGVWDSHGKVQLKNLTFEELVEWCKSVGFDSRRAEQLWRALYQNNRWIRSMSDMDGTAQRFAAAFKSAVCDLANLSGGLTLQSVSTARDGTHKLVFTLDNDQGAVRGNVETVLIPMKSRDGSQLRCTACLSSQVGCAMNCQFCYTGRMGLLGNLSTAQIVEQLVQARRWLAQYTQQQQHQQQFVGQQQPQQQDDQTVDPQDLSRSNFSSSSSSRKGSWPSVAPKINNVVFMGMGEPLHNMSALMPALDVICHPQGLGLSRAKVIVSTVGLVPELRALRASGKAKLAVSLHATTDEVRSWIVPTNRKYPLDQLIGALRELYPLPQGKGLKPNSSSSSEIRSQDSSSSIGVGSQEDSSSSRSDLTLQQGSNSSSNESKLQEDSSSSNSDSNSISDRSSASDDFVVIEYVLLKDVNDTDDDAYRLLELLADVYCMVNLIVFNPHEGTRFQRSDDNQVKRFRQILMQGGKVCTLRMSKGDDEMAACGQLGNPNAVTRPAPMIKPPSRLQEVLPGAAAAAEQHQQWLQQQKAIQRVAA